MSVSSPSEEDFGDDALDSVAEQVVGGTTRDQMLGTMSGISGRLVTAHNGAVRMHAEINDTEILIWSGVRVMYPTRSCSRRADRQMDGA